MSWKIEIAQKDDATIIQQLAISIWPKTYGEILGNAQLDYMLEKMYAPTFLAHQIESKEQTYSILYLDNEPIGFSSHGFYKDSSVYKLHKIYVQTNTQGKGFGRALLEHVIQQVKDLGGKFLVLNVNRYNLPAIQFYEKFGFHRIETVDIEIGNGYLMEDYVYQIDL